MCGRSHKTAAASKQMDMVQIILPSHPYTHQAPNVSPPPPTAPPTPSPSPLRLLMLFLLLLDVLTTATYGKYVRACTCALLLLLLAGPRSLMEASARSILESHPCVWLDYCLCDNAHGKYYKFRSCSLPMLAKSSAHRHTSGTTQFHSLFGRYAVTFHYHSQSMAADICLSMPVSVHTHTHTSSSQGVCVIERLSFQINVCVVFACAIYHLA